MCKDDISGSSCWALARRLKSIEVRQWIALMSMRDKASATGLSDP